MVGTSLEAARVPSAVADANSSLLGLVRASLGIALPPRPGAVSGANLCSIFLDLVGTSVCNAYLYALFDGRGV